MASLSAMKDSSGAAVKIFGKLLAYNELDMSPLEPNLR
jgi:hypothetical protein